MLPSLTERERYVVARILSAHASGVGWVVGWVAYLLPTALFAVYGVWRRDLVAVVVAYLVLFAISVLYLAGAKGTLGAVCGALRKYEAALDALEVDTTTADTGSPSLGQNDR